MRSQTSCHFYPRPPRGGRRQSSFLGCSRFLFLSTPSARRATTRIPPGSGAATNFYPRPLRGGRPYPVRTCFAGIMISIHALREEGDPLQSPPCALLSNFYPRPPRGGRRVPRTRRPQPVHFYPRPPRGGRPATALHRGKAAVFLSTPSARRATFWRFRNGLCDEISIHALREEGDVFFLTKISPIF